MAAMSTNSRTPGGRRSSVGAMVPDPKGDKAAWGHESTEWMPRRSSAQWCVGEWCVGLLTRYRYGEGPSPDVMPGEGPSSLCAPRDSNPEPTDEESVALPIELEARAALVAQRELILLRCSTIMQTEIEPIHVL